MEGEPVTDLPYMTRKQQHRIGRAGRKSEKRLTKMLRGRETAASGALGDKGDIDLGPALVEAKSTTQESLGVKMAWLAKIAREARAVGKSPALAISFVNAEGRPHLDGEWVCIPMHKFKEMFEWP